MELITEILNPSKDSRLIFFNPLGMNSDYWINELKIQNEFKDYELVFTNYPGYKEIEFINVKDFESLAILFYSEIKKLPQKETLLVGCSYGGNLAIKLAKSFDITKKIVLIGSIPYSDNTDLIFYNLLKKELEKGEIFEFSKKLIEHTYTKEEKNKNPYLPLMFFSYLKSNHMSKTIMQQIKHLEQNEKYNADSITPLFIIGGKDPLIRSNFKKKCSEVFQKYRIHLYQHHGHFTLNNNKEAISLIKKYIS